MKKLIISFVAVFLSSSLLIACTNQQLGTTGGAVVGGVAGSALTGGSTAGTIAGAVGGGYVGNRISR